MIPIKKFPQQLLPYRDEYGSFVGNIDVSGAACWIWCGYIDKHGYGQWSAYRKTYRAHRYMYEIAVGPIADGLTLDHLCGEKRCVNPEHLEPVTAAENSSRAAARTRGNYCFKGHELTPENTYNAPNGNRQCRTCQRAAWRRSYRRSSAAGK
jgi:hypothetical protein